MVNPISTIMKKGEKLLKHFTGDEKQDGMKDREIIRQVNHQKWVTIAVEKVNKGELWKEWFK